MCDSLVPLPTFVVGPDLSQATASCCLYTNTRTLLLQPFTIPNTAAGFAQPHAKLTAQATDPSTVLVGFEATGRCGDALYHFLQLHGYQVQVLHPCSVQNARTGLEKALGTECCSSPIAPRHTSCSRCPMIYLVLAQILSLLLDLFTIRQRSEQQKDLEILLLRQQLRMLQRQHPPAPRVSRWEKLGLAVLAARFASLASSGKAKLDAVLLLFKPDTVLKWHRELLRRKWTLRQRHSGGRSATVPKLQELLLRLAAENPSWSYSKLQGELLKLGYKIGRSTVRDILKRQHVPPAPERARRGNNWATFLGHYAQQMISCDFFTVETAWLKTL